MEDGVRDDIDVEGEYEPSIRADDDNDAGGAVVTLVLRRLACSHDFQCECSR